MDLWLDLLNSDWHDYRGSGRREDRVDDPAWLRRYLSHWPDGLRGIPAGEVRAVLKNLRSAMRAVVDQLAAGKTVPQNLWTRLNAFLAASPAVWRMGTTPQGYALDLVPQKKGLPKVTAEIAESFCATLARGEAARIKVCDNKDCLWVFYDRSKNRSKRWCEGETGCGNLMKVRRFRAKKK